MPLRTTKGRWDSLFACKRNKHVTAIAPVYADRNPYFSTNVTNQFRLGFLEAYYITGPAATITSADLSSLHWPNPFSSPTQGYPGIEFDSNSLNDGLTYNGGGSSNNVMLCVHPAR